MLLAGRGESSVLPLAFPIQNVTLANGFSRRGIALSPGYPGQALSFAPIWPQRDVYIYNSSACGSDSHECITQWGGVFEPYDSSTYLAAASLNQTYDTTFAANVLWVEDSFQINTAVTLDSFTMGQLDIHTDETPEQNAIGLGNDSTLLAALFEANMIASRSWSMLYGLDAPDDQMDGSLVLGGYDEAKTSGSGLSASFNSSTDCSSQMLVQVSGLDLNFEDGTNVTIIDESRSFEACILPSLPTVMTLSAANFEAVNDIWGGPVYNVLGEKSGGPYYGTLLTHDSDGAPYPVDMTINITINGAVLPIRISNSQLFTDYVTYASDGSLSIDASQQLARIYPTTETPVLGSLFLTSAYLYASLDTQSFTLWQANATTATSLVGVDSSGSAALTPNSSVSSTSSSTSTTSAATAKTSHRSLPAGSTAAIAVAGALVGGILLFATMWLWDNRNGTRPWLEEDPTSVRARLHRFTRFLRCAGPRQEISDCGSEEILAPKRVLQKGRP